MDNLIIRKVKETDALNWHRLKNKVWRETYKDILPETVFDEKDKLIDKKVEKFHTEIKNDHVTIAYVVELNGDIIGLMLGCIRSNYNFFANDYAELSAIYIDSKYQGKKIGTELKDIFEKWVKENGSTKYMIGVFKDNIKARKIYESWGGKLSNYEEDFIKFGIGYPEVFYTFDL